MLLTHLQYQYLYPNGIVLSSYLETPSMVTSIILLTVDRHKVNEVAEKLTNVAGVSEVYSVSGNYDLVVMIRVATNDDLADLVTNQFVDIDGIETTESMLAFKAFSKHDLESMFSV